MSEYLGLAQVTSITQYGIVEHSKQKRVRYDTESGIHEVAALSVRVRYTVNEKDYIVARQWTADFMSSNGDYPNLVSRFALGNKVEVTYVKGFPELARIVALPSLGAFLMLLVFGSLFSIFALVLIPEFIFRSKTK